MVSCEQILFLKTGDKVQVRCRDRDQKGIVEGEFFLVKTKGGIAPFLPDELSMRTRDGRRCLNVKKDGIIAEVQQIFVAVSINGKVQDIPLEDILKIIE